MQEWIFTTVTTYPMSAIKGSHITKLYMNWPEKKLMTTVYVILISTIVIRCATLNPLSGVSQCH